MDSLSLVTKLPELLFVMASIYAFVLMKLVFEISKWMVSFTPPTQPNEFI